MIIKKPYQSFEDLNVWKESIALCVDVYTILKGCRNYSFRDQMQKSAVSIPSNVAEGFERRSNKEFVQFLYIAKASCGELRTQFLIAMEIGIIKKEVADVLIDWSRKVSSMIQNLIKAIQNFK